MVLDAAAGVSAQARYHPVAGLSAGRAEVYQAIGMISVQLGVSLEEASVRLRARAFASGRPPGEIADDVVGRRLRFDPDPDPDPDLDYDPDSEPLA